MQDMISNEAEGSREYLESKVIVEGSYTRYNRNIDARNRSRKRGKYTCAICSFNSEEIYSLPEIIHVHHKIALSELESNNNSCRFISDKDLVCVCPTCHAVIHHKSVQSGKKNDMYSIEEVREMIEKTKLRQENNIGDARE